MLRHNCQSCVEMTVDLQAKRNHLNKILGSFFMRPKYDQRNLEADVTSCVAGVNGIDFFVQKHCVCPK